MSRHRTCLALASALTAAAFAPGLTGCGSSSDGDDPNAPPYLQTGPEARSALSRDLEPAVAPGEIAALTAGETAFALELYGSLQAPGENFFFSPLSIHQAMTMATAGARGTTLDEMSAVLHLPAEPHVAQNALDLSLAAAGQVPVEGDGSPLALEIANSLWGAPQLTWKPDFLDVLAVNYGAGLQLTDFEADPEQARTDINAWVSDKTRERIPELLAEGTISVSTAMVMVNAIFFKASWADAFLPELTANAPFQAPTGEVQVPMMSAPSLEVPYGTGEGWQAVELPYVGGRTSMTVVLPDDLAAFEGDLDAARLAEIRGSLAARSVSLKLPRFEFSTGASLADALQALGMEAAFGGADFSGMTDDEPLVISDVIHQAFVKVDEEGTEAAAATAVVFERTTAEPEPPVPFTADRPFVFFIQDNETGALLFAGRVANPAG